MQRPIARTLFLIIILVFLLAAVPWLPAYSPHFYPLETHPDSALSFRWTSGDSVLVLPNPGSHPMLKLRMFAGPAGATPLVIAADDAQVALTVYPGVRRYNILLPTSSRAMLELHFGSPVTEVHGRTLGVALIDWSLQGNGTLPLHAALGLLAFCSALIVYAYREKRPTTQRQWVTLVATTAIPVLSMLTWQRWLLFTLPVLDLALFCAASVSLLVLIDAFKSTKWLAVASQYLLAPLLIGLLAWLLLPLVYGPSLLLGVVLATVGLFKLLRQAEWSRLDAAFGTSLALCGALLWYQSDIWRSEAVVPLLIVIGVSAYAAVLLERWQGLIDADDQASVQAHLNWRPLLVLVGLALVIRLPFVFAPDPVGDLELSARRMAELSQHGLAGAFTDEGDYMPLRLSILTLLARMVQGLGGSFLAPLPPLTLLAIKLPSLLAECLTVVLLYVWALSLAGKRKALLLTAIYTLSAPVWINSAWWGQVDALLMLPLLASVLLLTRCRLLPAWAAWSLALLIKTQAIIVLPVLVFVTLRRFGCRGLVYGVLTASGVWLLGAFPFVVAGQTGGMLNAYAGAVGRFTRATTGAYNLWYLAVGPQAHDTMRVFDLLSLRQLGMLLLASVVGLVCIALWRRPQPDTIVRATTVSAFAFFMLPTQIHERYLFLTLAFALASSAFNQRRIVLYLLLMLSATLNVLGELSGFVPVVDAFASHSVLPQVCAVINLALLGWMVVDLIYSPSPRPLSHEKRGSGVRVIRSNCMTEAETIESILQRSTFSVDPERFAMVQAEEYDPQGAYFLVTKDPFETTVVARESELASVRYSKSEQWFKLVRIAVAVPFFSVGFLANVTRAIATRGHNVLVISTFTYDYILIREPVIEDACAALQELGMRQQ